MDDRAKRIVETAVELAERDGFQAVRLRDVAATAQVALGTVYKRFASKEEILIAALEQESEKLVAKLGKKAVPGETAQERLHVVFAAITRGFLRRPNLAKATVRSLASGDPNITERVASFHALITALVLSAIRGEAFVDQSEWREEVDQREHQIASVLQNVWFASFVGWAGGLHDVSRVLEDVDMTIELLFVK
ncbi:MAG: TetR family transcriptional regulator [Myxococcales bacterium]|nr:TetR family transcriptional regulator [Myxococcales bacterium]MDH3485422.1 TetR family transcriptional regulator [Myxococcales bacterium]